VEPAFEHASFDHRVSRRHSNVPAFSNSPRAVSPEYRRAYSPVSTIRNGNTSSEYNRSGARSPVSTLRNEGIIRAESPLRSELISPSTLVSPISTHHPMARSMSPARGVGNIAPNGNAFASQQQAAQQHQATLAALQGHPSQPSPPEQPNGIKPKASRNLKERHRLSLQTQIPPPPPVPEEEEMEEVITMSPAARQQPVTSFRKSRSSLALSMMSAGPGASSSQINLSGMNLTSDPHKPYFGQNIDHNDLIATGIENAFTRL